MISVQRVTKRYGRTPAVENISFKVETGQVYGLLGYNGAGKTTLLKIIAGAYAPDSGFVSIDGSDVGTHDVPAKTPFIVADEPYFGSQATPRMMRDYYAGYYPGWSDEAFEGLLGLFGLDAGMRIASFSKGMQRQVAILLGLSSGTPCLLLDESFDGLDLGKRILMKSLLSRYARVRDASVVLSSHNLKELEEVADRLGMVEGRHLVFDAGIDELHGLFKKYRAPLRPGARISDEALRGAVAAAGELRWSYVDHDPATGADELVFTARGDAAGVAQAVAALPGAGVPTVAEATLEEIFLREEEVRSFGLENVLF